MLQRIQKILAQAGIASRRKSEELIAKNRVSVNGKPVKLGDKADPDKDKIVVNGRPIKLEKKVYIMLNKPKGFVTTVSEEYCMKTVMDLVDVPERVFPVGRLDKNTEGLLLLTNDGDFANKLTHPSYEV
ncbi:RNA pseudouridylate synthase [uncultured archaeon]|nr:RNA pseudouridylate synthase [uncultured archaeon]